MANEDEKYELGQLINRGTFATLHVVRNHVTQSVAAVKVVHQEKTSVKQLCTFMREIHTLRSMSHPHIMSLISNWTYKSRVYMLMPLMHLLSCADIIREKYHFGLPETAIGFIINRVLDAVEYLHENNVVHRAIKGSHILIDSDGTVRLSGFKYSIQTEKKGLTIYDFDDLARMTKCLNWLSPEILSQNKSGYTLSTDIYSIGITVLELANGVVPFSGMSPIAMLVKKMESHPPMLWDKNFLPSQEGALNSPNRGSSANSSRDDQDILISNDREQETDAVYAQKSLSKSIHSFTTLCLFNDPTLRADVDQLIKHKFTAQFSPKFAPQLIKLLDLDPVKFHCNHGRRAGNPEPIQRQGDCPEASTSGSQASITGARRRIGNHDQRHSDSDVEASTSGSPTSPTGAREKTFPKEVHWELDSQSDNASGAAHFSNSLHYSMDLLEDNASSVNYLTTVNWDLDTPRGTP